MLERYFPVLVAHNVDSLRWKKFLVHGLALSLGLEPGPAPAVQAATITGIASGPNNILR
jgi:NifQ